MAYIIYGKRTEPVWYRGLNKPCGPDKTFRALDARGVRVTKLADAKQYDTKEEAQARTDKSGGRKGVIFDIRKA